MSRYDFAMQMMRSVFVLFLIACGGSDGGSVAPQVDAAAGALCTGAVYDTCVSSDQCVSQACHLYNANALQICTQPCSATVPCPNDAAGAPVACNQMGNCKPSVANNCHR
jgi:hypothetical protein